MPVLLPLLGTATMFTPTVATLVVMYAMKQPRVHRARLLGLWPLRPAKRVVWFIIGFWLAPPLVVMLIIAISASLGLVTLDLVNFSGFQEAIDAQLADLAAVTGESDAASAALPPLGLLVAMQLVMIPVGALVNSIFAAGEEIGWRGWLLPALRPLGLWPALVLHGAIWGLWHSPLILLGYNFGYLDWRGVALMTVGCVMWGIIFGWSRLRSGSVWPAVIGHGSLNASAGLVMLVAAAGGTPNMAIVGPLGVIAWIVIAAVTIALTLSGQFRHEPELAPKRVWNVPTTGLPADGRDHPGGQELREH